MLGTERTTKASLFLLARTRFFSKVRFTGARACCIRRKVQWGNGTAGQVPVTVHKTGTSDRNQNMITNVRFSHTTTKP